MLNWNIFKDVFVFQEIENEVCMVELHPDSKCRFFKFALPKDIKPTSQKDGDNNKFPNRLIGYWNKNILLVVENKIYNFNVEKYLKI